jgi:hypothetical protein
VEATVDLARHIPAPAAGSTAATAFAGAGYTGTVEWKAGPDFEAAPQNGLFLPGTAYRAEATVYAMPGYALRETAFIYSGGGALNGAGEWKRSEDGHSVEGLRIDFPAVPLLAATDLDLTTRVLAPAAGEPPVIYFAAPQYTGTVAWAPPVSGAFAENTAYTATATLTAAKGYTFAGAPEKPAGTEAPGAFAHGKGAVAHGAGAADSPLAVVIVFEKTGLTPVEVPIVIKW